MKHLEVYSKPSLYQLIFKIDILHYHMNYSKLRYNETANLCPKPSNLWATFPIHGFYS
ncbi:Uncharacterised protein [Capnocytophaga canimorsus]|nr:hypothetical protein CLV61_1710 [Capnocytophaga canimorsus]STA71426.1 Uncharacterised protein [Capnocytophaga canimorsus]